MGLLRNVLEQSPSVFSYCITSPLVPAFFVTWLCFIYIYHASLPHSTYTDPHSSPTNQTKKKGHMHLQYDFCL